MPFLAGAFCWHNDQVSPVVKPGGMRGYHICHHGDERVFAFLERAQDRRVHQRVNADDQVTGMFFHQPVDGAPDIWPGHIVDVSDTARGVRLFESKSPGRWHPGEWWVHLRGFIQGRGAYARNRSTISYVMRLGNSNSMASIMASEALRCPPPVSEKRKTI